MSMTQLMKFLLHTESRLQSPDVHSLLERLASETTPSYSTQRASRATDRWEWPGDEAIIMYCVKGCGFRSVRYVEVKIILESDSLVRKIVRYRELGGCPLLGGS